jgi:hypothetical protein
MPPSPIADFVAKPFLLNQQGVYVLASWVLLNFLLSGGLYWRASGPTRSFHLMNVGWNVVNLLLVIYTLANPPLGSPTLSQLVSNQYFNEKIYLFNAGLDVGYFMLGLYLLEKAKTTAGHLGVRFRGFGWSVLLQALFLTGFDWAMFLLHARLTRELLGTLGI